MHRSPKYVVKLPLIGCVSRHVRVQIDTRAQADKRKLCNAPNLHFASTYFAPPSESPEIRLFTELTRPCIPGNAAPMSASPARLSALRFVVVSRLMWKLRGVSGCPTT